MGTLPQISGPLFEHVQREKIFSDAKTFVDSVCLIEPDEILRLYETQHTEKTFNLKDFILTYFFIPEPAAATTLTHSYTLIDYINYMWDVLKRTPDDQKPFSTRIALPHNYIIPGGRFREIYYWDTFFTCVGLIAAQQHDLVKHMCDNFAYLINTYGHIPNGNRMYYLSRSQPPMFTLMVNLLTESTPTMWQSYLSSIEKEYAYWMQGESEITSNDATHHVVKISEKMVANRYYDELDTPRPESYQTDISYAQSLPENKKQLFYKNIRAAAESGWDFSSRWYTNPKDRTTIRTTDIIPIDLNCLLYITEVKLSEWYTTLNNYQQSASFSLRASRRKAFIQEYFWSPHSHMYFDYNFQEKQQTQTWSLACVFPLFAGIATVQQAEAIASHIQEKFLSKGGLITTLTNTSEQWDAPNGWPPLHWITVQALENYGHNSLANEIKKRFIQTVEYQFMKTGTVLEKYNVQDIEQIARGGDYPVQPGFGWTNGIVLDFLQSMHS